MRQMRFPDVEYAGKRKQSRRERFLADIDQLVPWTGLLGLIEPLDPKAGGGKDLTHWSRCSAFTCCKSARLSTAKRRHSPK